MKGRSAFTVRVTLPNDYPHHSPGFSNSRKNLTGIIFPNVSTMSSPMILNIRKETGLPYRNPVPVDLSAPC